MGMYDKGMPDVISWNFEEKLASASTIRYSQYVHRFRRRIILLEKDLRRGQYLQQMDKLNWNFTPSQEHLVLSKQDKALNWNL